MFDFSLYCSVFKFEIPFKNPPQRLKVHPVRKDYFGLKYWDIPHYIKRKKKKKKTQWSHVPLPFSNFTMPNIYLYWLLTPLLPTCGPQTYPINHRPQQPTLKEQWHMVVNHPLGSNEVAMPWHGWSPSLPYLSYVLVLVLQTNWPEFPMIGELDRYDLTRHSTCWSFEGMGDGHWTGTFVQYVLRVCPIEKDMHEVPHTIDWLQTSPSLLKS